LDRNGFKRSESEFDTNKTSISAHFNPFSFAGPEIKRNVQRVKCAVYLSQLKNN